MQKFNSSQLKNLSDKDLVSQINLNNKQVIEYLFFERCSTMFSYIRSEIFSRQISKDELISELYLFLRDKDWKIVREFEGRSKFSTWLSVVSVRFFLKKRAALIDFRSDYTLHYDKVMNIPGKNTYEEMICKMDLISAIGQLKNPRDKYVILSLEVEGYDADEVALQLGVTKANLYNIKKRAIEKLSKSLTDYNYANR